LALSPLKPLGFELSFHALSDAVLLLLGLEGGHPVLPCAVLLKLLGRRDLWRSTRGRIAPSREKPLRKTHAGITFPLFN
jgi:hypothetical protein